MPIVKPVSIHESPKQLIKYIMNPDKNEEMKFSTGIGCSSADADDIYNEFAETYERFAHRRFSGEFGNGKTGVLMFHYIQSFKPGECDAELAHKIGVQWAKRVFGSKRKVIVSTHVDKAHVHNHFAVSVYDNEGKRWYGNKKSLKRCREVSDKLALEYGLSVIDEPQYHSNRNYGEWLHRKRGDSWKAKLCDEIDKVVVSPNVNSVGDLIADLQKKGYEVRRHKYISIKPPKGKHFIRSFRLGDGYSLECLEYRILNKEQEMSASELSRYEGIQYKYAVCLREIQLMLYRKKPNTERATYYDVLRSAELLCYLSNNHITSEGIFKEHVNDLDEKYHMVQTRGKDIRQRIEFEERLLSQYPRFIELWNKETLTPKETSELGSFQVLIDYKIYEDGELEKHKTKLSAFQADLQAVVEETEATKAARKTAADNYRFYLEQMQGDYGMLFDRVQREKEQQERDIEIMREYDRNKYEQQNKTAPERGKGARKE